LKISSREVAQLKVFLARLKELAPSLPVEKPIFLDGTTFGQIAFHTGESADFWLRCYVLGQERPRVRDDEFRDPHAHGQIDASLTAAIAACDAVAAASPQADAVIDVSGPAPDGEESWTVALALLHVTSHTAEHVGQVHAAAELSGIRAQTDD
jgi:uncharacterized damage-inducible protein DinB